MKYRYCIFIFISLVMLVSCNKHTLRFFFDGVDQPQKEGGLQNSKQVVSRENSFQNRQLQRPDTAKQAKYAHSEYEKRNCVKCHDTEHAYRLFKRQPDLCYLCHKPFEQNYQVLHGPVAAGFCTACHLPHRSEYRYLLKMPVRDACTYCHNPGDVSKNKAHRNIEKTECIQCHNSHGGKTKNLLKDGIR